MRVQHQILGNLKENKEDWYYLCNDAEQALFKVKEQCKDERAIKSIERMILDLNNIRMEQYKALTEYSLVEEDTNMVKVKIYQTSNRDYAFMSYDFAKDKINLKDYKEVASIAIKRGTNVNAMLDEIFRLGNIEKQEFTTYGKFRSISVSDIIELDGKKYYVDDLGFKELNI